MAKAAGHRCGSRPPASRPQRGRRATAADLGCRRRDRGEGGRPARRILAAGVETVARDGVETAAREAGQRGGFQRGGPRPPASRRGRGRRAKVADLGRRRRDRGEGGGPPRRISVAGVETVAKAAVLVAGVETAVREAGRLGGSWQPASRPWRGTASRPRRGRRAREADFKEADLGRRRRDGGEGGGPKWRISAAGVETVAKAAGHRGGSRSPASRPLRGQRAEDFLDAKTRI